MELKKPLVIVLSHTISCVALHRRRYGVACFERLASGASQSNDKPFFKFHRVSIAMAASRQWLNASREMVSMQSGDSGLLFPAGIALGVNLTLHRIIPIG